MGFEAGSRVLMRRGRRLVLVGLTALVLIGCERPFPGQLAACQVYRPHVAKQTFDGRVGAVLLHNASPREVEVKVYHPDGLGDVELRRRVAAGAVLVLGRREGRPAGARERLGVQVEQSWVATLGQASEWARGEFSLRWDGENLQAGLGAAP